MDSLHKTAILGTSHIIRKGLQPETGSLSGGDHVWFKRNSGRGWSVTRGNVILVVIIRMMMMMMMIVITFCHRLIFALLCIF